MAIPRLNVLQHREFGKKVIKWALEPETRPKSLAEFAAQTTGIIEQPFPAHIKAVQFVQSNKEVLLIRLAPAEIVQDTLDRLKTATGKYPLPKFYDEYFTQGLHTDQREFFEFRVGDYTMAQCQ